MGLGIISDRDFESEIQNSSVDYQSNINSDNQFNPDSNSDTDTNSDTNTDKTSPATIPTIQPILNPGRHTDVNNVPQSLRKILGEEVATNGLRSAMHLAESLGGHGISQPTLSTYGRGEISPNHKSDKSNELFEYVNGRKTKITKRALNKLNLAMSLIDEEKLLGCDANELTNVAKGMAQVVKHMEPDKSDNEKKDPVQFHFYAPQIRNEQHYEVVRAKDNY